MSNQTPGIQQVRQALTRALDGTSQTDYAKRLGLTQGYISAVLSGAKAPGDEVCGALGYERVVTIRYRKKRDK